MAAKQTPTINWAALTEEAQVLQAVIDALPQAPMLEDVRAFCQAQGIECSERTNNVVYASAPAPGRMPLVRAKWLLEFAFDEDRLLNTNVSKGWIGP